MMGPYGSFGGGMGWGGWVAMAFAFVVFWGLVATGIVLLVRSFGHHHEVGSRPWSQGGRPDPTASTRPTKRRGG